MKFSLVLLSLLGSLALCQADTVRLQIQGPDGKPVAGAQVRVVDVGLRSRGLKVLPSVDLKSDGAGKLTLAPSLLGAKSASEFKKLSIQARVLAPGLGVALVNLKEGDNKLALRRGQSFGGVILDASDKPVAGVTVALSQLEASEMYSETKYFRGPQRLEARSDAQGRWHLDNVPASGPVAFSISDARFRGESFWLDVGHPAPPFFMERGATVKGRLLRPDGKPAAGVEYYAGNASGSARTKADGTFRIGGLGDTFYFQGTNYLGTQSPFIVPLRRVENLEPGEVRDLGTIKTKASFHYRGKVVDGTTNKPIVGATVWAWGNGTNSMGESDSEGRFDLLVAPGTISVSVSAFGFVSQSLARRPPANAATPVTPISDINVGLIKLKKAITVKGTVVTADGKGIGTSIRAYKARGSSYYARSDEQGNFKFGELEVGQYTVLVPGHKLKTPVKMVVGPKGVAPLRIVLTDAQEAQRPSLVTGRVLYNGEPMGGAKIRLLFRSESSSYEGLVAVSSADGTYSIKSPIANTKVQIMSVVRRGYSAQYDDPKIQDGVWRGDINLQKLGEVRGRVVDSGGIPVSGASVALGKGSDLPVSADANGEFRIKDVASAGITLLASDGPRWQSFKVESEGEKVQIVLPDATPVADRVALAERIVPNSSLDWEVGKKWQVRGEALGATLVRARALGGSWNWKDMLHMQAERAPENFLTHEKENREKVPPNSMAEFEPILMLARASSKDKATRERVKAWLSEQEKVRREISRGSISQLLELAEIAQKMDPAQAAMWSEYAAQLADQIPSDQDNSWELGKMAARVSPRAVETLIEECKPVTKLQYLSSAMNTYADRGDRVSARQIFVRMQKLAQQVEAANKPKTKPVAAPKTKTKAPRYRTPKDVQMARSYLLQGREQLAYALASTDPAGALGVQGQLQSYQRPAVLLVVARSAVRLKKYDVARKAIAEMNTMSWAPSEYGAQFAAIALGFDKPLADELFRTAYRQFTPQRRGSYAWRQIVGYEDSNWSSIGDYAKARATQWPGESRILIEREWTTRQEATKKKDNPNYANYANSQNMKSLVAAMAEIDPQRAVEMLALVPNQYGLQGAARGEIAVALLRGVGG